MIQILRGKCSLDERRSESPINVFPLFNLENSLVISENQAAKLKAALCEFLMRYVALEGKSRWKSWSRRSGLLNVAA